jgi:hypothetical protein
MHRTECSKDYITHVASLQTLVGAVHPGGSESNARRDYIYGMNVSTPKSSSAPYHRFAFEE